MSELKIVLSREAELKLTAWNIATNGREFSGLGLIERDLNDSNMLHVVDVDLLGVGSTGLTIFTPERQRALPLDPRRKLWFHKHPIGSGNLGDPSNWSGTDEHTATREPLGGIPELVRWSVAIVRTPGGWVGRVDFHVPQTQTFHCPVEPRLPTPETLAEAEALLEPELYALVDDLLKEFEAMIPKGQRIYTEFDGRQYSLAGYEITDDDMPEFEPSGMWCPQCGAELCLEEQEVVSGVVTVTTMSCPDCQNFFYHVDDDGTVWQIDDQSQYVEEEPAHQHRSPRRKTAPWQRSFWKAFRR